MYKQKLLMLIIAGFLLQSCGLSSGEVTPSGSSESIVESATQPPSSDQAAIQHIMKPSVSSNQGAFANDNDSAKTAENRTISGGDEYRFNRFERPFTADTMDYLPYVDIESFAMTSDTDWYYVQILLKGKDASGDMSGVYGAEFDLDKDGRAEFLFVAEKPGNEWSTNGVKVYFDGNGDVGGFSSAPDEIYTGNGFETIIFDQGNGDDPDLAWVRFVDSSAPIVELAIKVKLFEEYNQFMWGVLASASPVDPTRFYYNDTYSEEQAGSPVKGTQNYPLKQVAAFDNSCRVPFGFSANGSEPLGCNVSAQPQDTEFTPGIISISINPVDPVVQPAFP